MGLDRHRPTILTHDGEQVGWTGDGDVGVLWAFHHSGAAVVHSRDRHAEHRREVAATTRPWLEDVAWTRLALGDNARAHQQRQMSVPGDWSTDSPRNSGAGDTSSRLTSRVRITCGTPTVDQLPVIAEQLSLWQQDPWAGHLHPGDLGWHSSVGPEQMANDLRLWVREGVPIAMGMLDGSVLRMAVDPALAHDQDVADGLAHDLGEAGSSLFTGDEAIVEARGAHALTAALNRAGWVDDEPWTPLAMDLTNALDMTRLEGSGLRIEEVGPDAADVWTSIHWSSFKGTPFDDESRSRLVQRWTLIMTGPFADRAHSLVAYNRDGTPVAVMTVWTASQGRPGLVEPMGVHRDHHGKGYGVAITLAGARTLKQHGATSAAVVAENSNPAALATYVSAGFVSLGEVTDLKRL